jgi:ribulose-5-phosphate 4-epimerase/fuculose-1-phosphate aldolase
LLIGLLEGAVGLEVESRDDKSDAAVEVARAILYPNTGIAATLDDSDNVVVIIE